MAEARTTGDPVPGLLNMLDLMSAAIAVVKTALASNPSTEQDRTLRRTLLRLFAERTALEAELDAALAGDTSVAGPSDDQVLDIAMLSGEVERLTQKGAAAKARIAFAGRVLDLATEVLRVS